MACCLLSQTGTASTFLYPSCVLWIIVLRIETHKEHRGSTYEILVFWVALTETATWVSIKMLTSKGKQMLRQEKMLPPHCPFHIQFSCCPTPCTPLVCPNNWISYSIPPQEVHSLAIMWSPCLLPIISLGNLTRLQRGKSLLQAHWLPYTHYKRRNWVL